jgi:GDP-mannose 6-dehydrogenase
MNKEISSSICVFGLGYIGCVSAACLAQSGYKVVGVDINEEKVDLVSRGIPTIIEPGLDLLLQEGFKLGRISATLDVQKAVADSEIMMITVGTPCQPNGDLDLSHIYAVAEDIGKSLVNVQGHRIIAIRSTVKPNTCNKVSEIIEQHSGKKIDVDFSVVANPEFLREGTAIQDYLNPPYILIGSNDLKVAYRVASIYANVNSETYYVKLKTAEIIKYVNNSWHALKVAFGNEIGSVCKALNVDSHEVMDLFCRDKILNISANYLRPGFAYGGACLPKDLSALISLSREAKVSIPLLESIDESNESHIQRALTIIKRYKTDTRIGFLGVSFKTGTDDVRGSPALKIIKNLLENGYDIKVYDDTVSSAIVGKRNVDMLKSQLENVYNIIVESQKDILEFAEILVIAKNDPSFELIINAFNGDQVLDLVGMRKYEHKDASYVGLAW